MRRNGFGWWRAAKQVVLGSGPPTLEFASRWSNSTGNTSGAFRDGTNFDATVAGTGADSEVATASSLSLTNWPVDNVFRVRANVAGAWANVQVQWDLGVPSPGDHRYFRYYYQNTVPNTVTPDATTGNIEHGIETADAALGGGDGFNPYHLPLTDGTWWYGYREQSTAVRHLLRSTTFQKNRTYRIEWHLTYGTGNYTAECRIYDHGASAAGTLIVDSSNASLGGDNWYQFLPADNPALTLRTATFTLADFTDHQWLRFGNNGPSSNFPLTGINDGDGYCHIGAVAVSFDTWCGPYLEGNG